MSEQHEDKGSPGDAADMPFGGELRREREMRNVSIREISETTKISTRFLEAIETGDFSSLPAPVFTRGFIREYATYLGLDSEDLVDRYMSVVEREERQREHEEEEMRDRINDRLPIGPGTDAFKWIVIAVVAIVILGAGVYFLATAGEEEPQPVPGEQTDAAEESPRTTTPEPATEPAEATADSIRMTMNASSDSWIDLQIDDQPPMDFTLQEGRTRTFEAEEQILIRTVGNAGGVSVELNGMQIGPLGRVNQVVRNVGYDLEKVNEMLRQQSIAPAENQRE